MLEYLQSHSVVPFNTTPPHSVHPRIFVTRPVFNCERRLFLSPELPTGLGRHNLLLRMDTLVWEE